MPRHQKSKTRHPQCNENCPLHEKLHMPTRSTSSQSRASKSSSQGLSVPAGTSETSSSLGGFDMDIDLQEDPQVTKVDNGWYLFPLFRGLLIYTLPPLDNHPSTRVYKILVVLEPSRRRLAPPKEVQDTEWLQEDLANGMEILSDPTFKGFIFPDLENPSDPEDSALGYVGVWIHEKVSAIGFRRVDCCGV